MRIFGREILLILSYIRLSTKRIRATSDDWTDFVLGVQLTSCLISIGHPESPYAGSVPIIRP